jgi:hypothetical protein
VKRKKWITERSGDPSACFFSSRRKRRRKTKEREREGCMQGREEKERQMSRLQKEKEPILTTLAPEQRQKSK